jgi:hypothetical protein
MKKIHITLFFICITFSGKLFSQYCTPSGSFSACAFGLNDFWITNVSFAGPNSTFAYSGGSCVAGAPFYLNTGYTGSVDAGSTYTLSLTRAGNTYITYFNAWVDWNNNGVLSDLTPDNERIAINIAQAAGGALTSTVPVTIPAGIVTGDYRMRVRIEYNVTNANNPCRTAGQAESKDFTLHVVSSACIPPTLTVTATANTVCLGSFVTLTASGASSISWSNGVFNGSPFAPGSSNVYTVTGDNGLGCTTTSTVSVGVISTPTVTVTNAANCLGGESQLFASGADSYTWSTGTTVNGLNSVIVSPPSTTTYTVTGTTNNCSAQAVATMTIFNLPTVTINASATIVCEGETITLSGEGADQYFWNNGVSDGVSFTPSDGIIYNVGGVDNNGCANFASITITVNPLPIVTANASANPVCEGSMISLTGGGADSYSWDNGINNGVDFLPINGTTYNVIGTDANGCNNNASVAISINPLPIVSLNLSAIDTLCVNTGNVTLLGESPSGGMFSGNGVSGNVFNTSIAGIGTHTIDYEYLDGNGCSAIASATIFVDLCTAISNAQNENNVFTIAPNPASSQVIINLNENANQTLTLMDVLGKTLKSSVVNNKHILLNTEDLQAGIYFISISNTALHKMQTQKLIIQK